MKPIDWVILLLLAAAVAAALTAAVRNKKKGGCCGNCEACGKNCAAMQTEKGE